MMRFGANAGPLTVTGEWWRLVTSTFLHFGLVHLLVNMWALWVMGRVTERLFGSGYFLLLYLFSGLCGSLASTLWRTGVTSAGASGAIFGVIGALIAFMVNPTTNLPPTVAKRLRASGMLFIAYNLMNGATHQGIDNAAHLGGLIGGFVLGFVLARPLDRTARMNPAPRLAAALALGTLCMGALAHPLVHPPPEKADEWRFQANVRRFLIAEPRLVAEASTLESQRASQRLSSPQVAARMRKDLLPQWQAAVQALEQPSLPASSRLAPVQEALISYARAKSLALDEYSDYLERDDYDSKRWAERESGRAADWLKQLHPLLSRLYE